MAAQLNIARFTALCLLSVTITTTTGSQASAQVGSGSLTIKDLKGEEPRGEIAGRWVTTYKVDGVQVYQLVVFAPGDMSYAVRVEVDGKHKILEGNYKLDGNQLKVTMLDGHTFSGSITWHSPDKLTYQGKNGTSITYVRFNPQPEKGSVVKK